MKNYLFLFLFLCVSWTNKPAPKETFQQDVAFMHSTANGLPANKISSIILVDDVPSITTPSGTFQWDDEQWKSTSQKIQDTKLKVPAYPKEAQNILTEVAYKDGYAIGCENGLYIYKLSTKKWERSLPADENYSWALRDVAALVVDSKGRLWFGAKEGVGYQDGDTWKLFTGKEGLPYNHFTCAAAGPDGIVWFGTEHGAIRAEDDYFYYRFSRRWLPDDYVNDIAVQNDGTAWIATNKGVSQIASKTMSFEEKADYFTKQVEDRHNRMGFIATSLLSKQFDVSTSALAITDNDGLYTAMYGAANAFRYAATKDKKAKELALRSFYACKWLVDITHEPGFPARVIIPIDWHEPVNEQYGHEYNLRKQKSDPFWKDIYPRFPKSDDGKYRWKCDTSSDELAGHYFYYGIFYDLVAETEEEKAAVRQVVADATDHLIRHGFKLVDHDGEPTRWGNFNPEYFNSVWGWDQRGLNSMMMLSFLNVASHVTGDSKYDEVAEMLREKHQYHINAMHGKEFFPPENVVPWDNNLSLMSFYGLINYEKDPELLLMYRNSLENVWLHVSKQKNAFWDAMYGALANRFTQLVDDGYFENKVMFPENKLYAPAAIERFYQSSLNTNYIRETLERIPLDLIGYTMDNTHRLDVVFDPTPVAEPNMGWRTDGYALPMDERGHVRLDRDGFALLSSEGNGYAEHEGTFYLLPYYMSLYHNLIQ